MKKILILLNGLLLFSCSNGQNQIADNGLRSSDIQLSEEQTKLIYDKTKSFPENTELSIAIINNKQINFVGIKRHNDSIIQTKNRKSIFEM